MTEKEKEKAYNEAIERVKNYYGKRIIEEIFTELKESEDDKIRKEIISILRNAYWTSNKNRFNELVAWLEKQSEQKPCMVQWKGDNLKEVISFTGKDKNFGKWFKSFEEYEKYVHEHNNIFKLFNENGNHYEIPVGAWIVKTPDGYNIASNAVLKQKHADTIEPRFNVGDWVVNKFGDSWHIDSFDKKNYQVSDGKGNYNYFPISKQDEMHIWTIQDAKDGDMLSFYTEYRGNKMLQAGIIKKYVGKRGGCSNTFKMYVGVNWDNNLQIGKYMGCSLNIECSDIHPATKEQRDFLFKKLKESGYKWNTETKTLEKLEKSSFHEGDWVVYNNDICQIVKREEGCNKLVTVFGIEKELVNERNLSTARLWTIQDANDGDVIYLGTVTAIFKKYIGREKCTCYCSFCKDGGFEIPIENGEDNVYGCYNVTPATKEQYDALMKAMNDAGYKWNAGTKTLEKLEKSSFHKGDWVVRGDTIAQILNIQKQYYIGLDINGKDFVSSRFLNSDKIHLWTIQDAKDGDFLCCKSGWMCIFKSLNNHTNTFSSYCFMDSNKCFFNNGSECHTLDKEFLLAYNGEIHPATKEQRDLLFQKIKEAGYKWNTETKTLEKLVEPKFKVGDKIVNLPMKYMGGSWTQGTISKITDDKYIFTDGSYISINSQDSWELVHDKKLKFDPKTLQPYDKVLIRRGNENFYVWFPDFVSNPPNNDNNKTLCMCVGDDIAMVIPYNNDTKHLIGTTNEAPEYYRYWED